MNARSGTRSSVLSASFLLALLSADSSAGEQRDVFRQVAESQEVPWLERIAGSMLEAEKLAPRGGHGQSPIFGRSAKGLRTAAYARLGELGTEASLAAVGRIEAAAKGAGPAPAPAKVRRALPRRFARKSRDTEILAPPTIRLEVWSQPIWGYDDVELKPLGSAKTPDGKTYVVVVSNLLGGLDLFLMWSLTPEERTSWSPPALIPDLAYRGIRSTSLAARTDDLLVFSYFQEEPWPRRAMNGTGKPGREAPALGSQEREIRIQNVLRDQDGDGWTDAAELRLGLDPRQKDTDGDGLADGLDPCPNFAPPPGHETDEEVSILQKAIFATFGLSDSRSLLIANPDCRKVQIWGYRGPVIYLEKPYDWGREFDSAAIFVFWSATRAGDKAKVTISDCEGILASQIRYVYLKKIRNEWIVTKWELGPVS
jgi:hypothetical protein